jgi:hypothetical protein
VAVAVPVVDMVKAFGHCQAIADKGTEGTKKTMDKVMKIDLHV